MPARGIVTVEVSPLNARTIAWWLRCYHQPARHEGILGEVLWQYRDQHDVDAIAKKFEKLVGRKRVAPSIVNVSVQLSRADAEWLAKRVQQRRGMFGRRLTPPLALPQPVEWVCFRCLEATTKRRGRKMLSRERLQAALNRQHLDERHRKRLRRRQRDELATQQGATSAHGVLATALMDAIKST